MKAAYIVYASYKEEYKPVRYSEGDSNDQQVEDIEEIYTRMINEKEESITVIKLNITSEEEKIPVNVYTEYQKKSEIDLDFSNGLKRIFIFNDNISENLGDINMSKGEQLITYLRIIKEKNKIFSNENPEELEKDLWENSLFQLEEEIKIISEGSRPDIYLDFSFLFPVFQKFYETKKNDLIKNWINLKLNFEKVRNNFIFEKEKRKIYYDNLVAQQKYLNENEKEEILVYDRIYILFLLYSDYDMKLVAEFLENYAKKGEDSLKNLLKIIFYSEAYINLDISTCLKYLSLFVNIQQLKGTFEKLGTLSNILKFIIENYTKINKDILNDSNEINISDFSLKYEDENFQEISQNLKYFYDNIYPSFPLKLELLQFWKDLINYYSEKDYDKLKKLLELYEVFQDLKKWKEGKENKEFNYFDDEIINYMLDPLIKTRNNLISSKKLTNDKLLDFLENEIKMKNYITSNNEAKYYFSTFSLFQTINFNAISNEFLNNYPTLLEKLAKITPNETDTFSNNFFKRIKDFSTFQKYICIMFPEDKITNEIVLNIYEKICELFQIYKEKDYDAMKETLKILCLYYNKLNLVFKESFWICIENSFGKKLIYDICVHLLKEGGKSINDINKHISKYLIDNVTDPNPTNLFNISNYYVNENTDTYIFDYFDYLGKKYLIEKDDFFSEKDTPNFTLLSKFINSKYYNDKYKFTIYFDRSLEILNNTLKRFKDLDFSIVQAKNLSELTDDNFYNRILIITLNKEEEAKELFSQNKDKLQKLQDYKTSARTMINYYNLFGVNNQDIVNRVQQDDETINKRSIKYVFERESEYETYIKESKFASKYNRFIRSKFYINIYNNYKITHPTLNDDDIRLKSSELFESLESLFKEDEKVDENLIEIILKDNNTMEILKSEVDILVFLFNLGTTTTPEKVYNIIENLFYFYNKKLIISLIKAQMNIIDLFNMTEKNDVYVKSSEILKLIKSNDFFVKISDTIKFMKENDLNLITKSKFYLLIEAFALNNELAKFIKGKKVEDVQNLNELINDSSDETQKSALEGKDIVSLIKAVEFFIYLESEITNNKIIKDSDFINLIKTTVQNKKEFKNIDLDFRRILEVLNDIKDIITKSEDRSGFDREIIKTIINKSTVYIKNENNTYKCYIKYNKNNETGKEKTENFNDIKALRDRASFKIKTNELKFNDYTEIFDIFNSIVNDLEDVLTYLELFMSMGYPEKYNEELSINDKKIYGKDGNEILLNDMIMQFDKFLGSIDEKAKLNYKENMLMTLIYGREIGHLVDFLRSSLSKVPDKSVNSYFIKILQKEKFNLPEKKYNSNDNNEYYTDVKNYLNDLLSANKMQIKDVFKKNIIISNSNLQKGINFSYENEEHIDTMVIKCYLKYTNNLPLYDTILYCTSETTSEELRAFLYRTLYYNYRILFTIMRPEKLSVNLQSLFISILQDFKKEEKEMFSTLLIFYYDASHSLIEQIVKLNNNKKPIVKIDSSNSNADQLILDKFFSSIEIVSSDVTGVGKSTQIREYAKNNYFSYHYFPIGGDFTRSSIINRLLKVNLSEHPKNLLHLDLMNTSNSSFYIMREFLFEFLILNSYSYNEKMFSYIMKNDLLIKIEIPNSFWDYKEKFKLLKMFKEKKYELKKIPKIIVSNNNKSYIQILSNYLDMKKQNSLHKEERKINEMKIYTADNCQYLLNEFFKIKNSNYYQKYCFINVLGKQLEYFAQNIYFGIEILKKNGKQKGQKNLHHVRDLVIDLLIELTSFFTNNNFDEMIKNKNNSFKALANFDNEEAEKEEVELCSQFCTEGLSFDKTLKYNSLVFFNEDGQSLTIICNQPKYSAQYKNLCNLYNSAVLENKDLIDYKKLDEVEDGYLKQLKIVLDKREDTKKIKETLNGYVFTADNFIKMIIILLKTRANIPVILMGETGCGKTRLMKAIADILGIKMEILNIHAGIDDNKIIEFIKKNNLVKTQKNNPKEKIWIFFDEINTCNSLGLISEMMLKHTMNSVELIDNLTFIAACNPYQKKSSEYVEIEQEGLVDPQYGKKNKNINLVYRVNPLPYCLLNFVLYFGSLDPNDEKKYIQSMITPTIRQGFNFEENNKNAKSNVSPDIINKYIEKAKNMLAFAQHFIRKRNGVASVSLREVKRFTILFSYFRKLLFTKKQKCIEFEFREKKFNYKQMTNEEIIRDSIILSIYLCYYLRISNKKDRKTLEAKMNEILLKGEDKSMQNKSAQKDVCAFFNVNESFKNIFYDIPRREEENLISYISLPPGIAKNRALLENVFATFISINNRIPIFICGKPGCSKSLSVKLVISSMRGTKSHNEFYRTAPKLIINSYQGSRTSNSAGVSRIFEKAKSILSKSLHKEDIISAVYFDEMGLAELSDDNPLKVIHSELELDNIQIAFIGISNWALDAAKMNRGLFLSIPEPDEEDLIETAKVIANSFNRSLGTTHLDLFEALAKTYYEYKLYLKERHSDIQNFHGSRDFYSLIKLASRYILNDGMVKEDAGLRSLERNFGGKEFSIKKVKEIFKRYIVNVKISSDYQIIKYINENINDNQSRYLLLISKASLCPFLVSSLMNKHDKKNAFFMGSQFEEDSSEAYTARILSKIQVFMEQEVVLILKNLETIYPSLYDLFNQNFTKQGNRDYARIALGSSNTVQTLVDPNFRVVVICDTEQIDKEEAPFLNRFEKHLVSFENLFNKEQIKISKEIYDEIFNNMITPQSKKMKTELKFDNLMINCDLDEIQGIMYDEYNKKIEEDKNNNKEEEKKNDDNAVPDKKDSVEISKDTLKQKILEKIVPTLCQDVIAAMSNSKLIKDNPELYKSILKIYNESYRYNINDYLNKMNNKRCVIYTFSDYLETIKYDNEIKNSVYGDINVNNIKEMKISTVKNEENLEKEIIKYYKDPNLKVFLVRFKSNEIMHLNHLKFLIEAVEKEKKISENEKKIFIFMIHIKRIFENEKIKSSEKKLKSNNLISHLSDYYQIFIDDINGQNLLISSFFDIPLIDVYKKFNINFDELIEMQIYSSLSYIKYDVKNKPNILSTISYYEYLKKEILKNDFIMNKMKNLITNELNQKGNCIFIDLFSKFKLIYENSDSALLGILIKYLKRVYEEYIDKFIIKAEEEKILSTLVFSKAKNNKLVKDYIDNNYFTNYEFKQELPINNEAIKVSIIHLINLPQIEKAIEEFKKKMNCYAVQLRNEEGEFRRTYDEEEINEFKENFSKKKERWFINVYGEFKEIKLFNYYLNNNNDEKFIDYILEDYYKLFLVKNLINNNLNEISKLIDLICGIYLPERNISKKEDHIKYICEKILFIEAYSDIIIHIAKIYIQIKKFYTIYNKENKEESENNNNANDKKPIEEDDEFLIKKIKYSIDHSLIMIEESKRSLKHKNELNKPFSSVIGGLILEITNKFNILETLSKYLDSYIVLIKNVVTEAREVDIDILLFSKELSIIKMFYKIAENLKNAEKLKEFGLLLNEDKITSEDDRTKILENLIKEYEFITNNFEKNKNFSNIAIDFLIFKHDQLFSEIIRSKIIELSIKNEKILSGFYQKLLFVFFRDKEIDPPFYEEENEEVDKNNKNNLDNNNNENEGKENEENEEEDNNEDDDENQFLSFATEDDEKLKVFYKDISEKNKILLNEQYLYFFETRLYSFFIKLIDECKNDYSIFFKGKLVNNLKLSLEFLKNYLVKIKDKGENLIKINNTEIIFTDLALLYSIAYIRIYLRIIVDFNLNEQNLPKYAFNDVFKVISENSSIGKVLQLYLLKLFRNKMNSFSSFLEFDWKKHQVELYFSSLFNFDQKNVNNKIFKYSFINDGLYKLLSENHQLDFEKVASTNDILDLFDYGVNTYYCKLQDMTYFENEEYLSFMSKFKEQISSAKAKNIICLINKINMAPDIKSNNDLEIFLYALKIVLLCCLPRPNTKRKDDNFYMSIFNEGLNKNIINLFIPGGESNLNKYSKAYEYMLKRFESGPNNKKESNKANQGSTYSVMAHMCECGHPFEVGDSFLLDFGGQLKCPGCGKLMKGKNSPLIYKVYKNEEEKNKVLKSKYKPNKNLVTKSILMSELKEMAAESNKENKGFVKIESLKYNDASREIRNMNSICYRLLIFINYSILYFAFKLKYITDKEIMINFMNYSLDENEKKNFSVFSLVKKSWNLLKKSLKLNFVNDIQIFLNIIFPPLSKTIEECDLMKTVEERNVYEEKVNTLIKVHLNYYDKLSFEYLEKNCKLHNINIESDESLLEEYITPDKLDKTKYPFMNYFMNSKIPDFYQFKEDFKLYEKKESCPIISNFIHYDKDLKNLQNLKLINPFANDMLKNCSYRFSRKDCKKIKINEMIDLLSEGDDKKKEEFKKSYDNFEKGTNNMKMLKNENMKNTLSSSYSLCDNVETEDGIYLKNIYQKFIDIQNGFLNNVIYSLRPGNKLYHFKNLLEKKIDINNSTSLELLCPTFDSKDIIYKNLMDIASAYSRRNCIKSNYSIDYYNYNSLLYDFSSIEEELGEILLVGKRLFSDKIKYVVYKYEEYLGDNSSLFTDFLNKYPQKALSEDETNKLFEFIINNKENMKFFTSLKILIFYLKNNKFDINKLIYEVINEVNHTLKFDANFIKFFNDNKDFKIEHLYEIFLYFEQNSFDDILENVDDCYKNKLSKEKENKIMELLNNPSSKINKKNLASALRKYISRNLSGKRRLGVSNQNNESDTKLLDFITSEEYWAADSEIDKNEILKLSQDTEILLSEAVDLYNKLGEDRSIKIKQKEVAKPNVKVEEKEDNNKVNLKNLKPKKKAKKTVH